MKKLKRFSLYELRVGSIEEVRLNHSEDIADKRMFCDITLDDGVIRKNIPFWGCGVDISSGNPHGIIFPPIENQMVGVLFIHGSHRDPVACIPFPRPMDPANEEKYYNILDDIEDGAVFHKSGSKIIMKKNGDIEIDQKSGQEVKINQPGAGDNSARKGDSVSSGMVDDPVFWTWLAAAAAVLAGLGVVAPIPTSLASKITSGSSNVKVG